MVLSLDVDSKSTRHSIKGQFPSIPRTETSHRMYCKLDFYSITPAAVNNTECLPNDPVSAVSSPRNEADTYFTRSQLKAVVEFIKRK